MNRPRLVLRSVLAAALLALAVGSGASSASRPARQSAAAPLLLQFHITNMPAGQVAQVTFSGGVQGISSQIASASVSASGTMRFFGATQQGFSLTSSGGTLNAGIDATVQPTDGSSAITGHAMLPQGATLAVQVNKGTTVTLPADFTIPLPTRAQAPVPGPCDSTAPGAMIGTDGNDLLAGTQGADTIIAKGGNDQIRGKDGHDRICAGPGNDTITAGSGHDEVLAGAGNDLVRGGPGHDHLTLGPGRDRGYGGTGHDTLVGNPGEDIVAGGPGDDRVKSPATTVGQ
jgi:Ca2+-binding RTX toxin-like protein